MATTVSQITTFDDGSKNPWSSKSYMDMRGVVDYGNLIQFAPYETGYCLLAVINGPAFAEKTTVTGFKDLQDAYIKVIEQEFKGLDGIDDITTETMDISDNISTLTLISKVVQNTNSQISMRFTEKAGSLLTKYNSTYLRMIKDPKTQAKTYGGAIKQIGDNGYSAQNYGFHMEVFNFLYMVTDATMLNLEKAFLILNAQPTTASYGELYNADKGEIGTKELTLSFNAFVVDGKIANKIGQAYLKAMVNNSETMDGNKININSWNYDWSYSADGTTKSTNDLGIDTTDLSKGLHDMPKS